MHGVFDHAAASVGRLVAGNAQEQAGIVQRAVDISLSVMQRASAQCFGLELEGPVGVFAYGSRVSGYGLPDSDVDICAEVPFKEDPALGGGHMQREQNKFLGRMLLKEAARILRDMPQCSDVSDAAVARKFTLTFVVDMALSVDLTFSQRPVEH